MKKLDTDNYLKKELYNLIQNNPSTFEFIEGGSLDGIWYWDLENAEQEWMSPRFWLTLGFNPEEKQHLVSEWQDLIHPEDLATAQDNLEKHLADPNHPYDQEVRYTHANGSTVWVRCRGLAIRDDNGKPIRMLGAHNDITKLKEMELRYKKSLSSLDELYAATKIELEESNSIFQMAPDAMLQVDTQGYITKANREAETLFGYSIDELIDKNVDSLVPSGARRSHSKNRDKYFKNPGIRPMGQLRKGISALHKDGHQIPVEIRLSIIKTRYGNQTLANIRDVTEQKALIESLEKAVESNIHLSQQATTDPLTGLYNRRYFEGHGEKDLASAVRHNNELSLILMDLDHFKEINDTYGHEAGDEVLRKSAQLMESLTRSGDILARIGGEEFALLLPHTSLSAAEMLAERIRLKIEEFDIEVESFGKIKFTCSLGVSTITENNTSINSLLKSADKALYRAKDKGRNCVVLDHET